MIKISIEYTIINADIVKCIPIIKEDESTTIIEKIIAKSVEILIKEATKNMNKTNVNEILENIGKS
jgi:hypothetical protein